MIDEISRHKNTYLVNVESNHYRFVYALLRSLTGPEKLHYSFNQSDSKLKPIPRFRMFGLRQWRYSIEPFKRVFLWAIHLFNSLIYIIVMYPVSFFRSLGTFQFSFAYFAREWWFLILSFKAEIGARLARIDPLPHAGCWTAVCRVPHKWLTLLSDGNHFFLTSW